MVCKMRQMPVTAVLSSRDLLLHSRSDRKSDDAQQLTADPRRKNAGHLFRPSASDSGDFLTHPAFWKFAITWEWLSDLLIF